MKKVHAQRLLKLADFLDALPRRKFDYAVYVESRGVKEVRIDDWDGGGAPPCGTVACALGWACTMPEFRRLGARLEAGLPRMKNGGEVDEQVFGLTGMESNRLFTPWDSGLGYGVTPKRVAKHIRDFVDADKRSEAT